MRPLLCSVALSLSTLPLLAQRPALTGSLGGTIGVSVPMGEFKDTWGHDMFTWGGHLALPHGLLPISAGFAFDYSQMGNTHSTVPVLDPSLTATEGGLTVRAKVMSYHGLLRFSPLNGKIRPYVDGLLGARQFTTLSKVRVDGLDQPVSTERNANDLVFSTGWAAGLMVGLGRMGYVEGRVERFFSGRTSYVDPASITVDGQGNVGFRTLESRTEVLNVMLGIGLRF
ncbi:MAG: hypothetical protein QM724_05075 [Flavobacteriales bacterium]